MRVKIRFTGIVQGVGFRPFIYRIAVKNCLNGYVRNMGDANVEIFLEGKETRIKNFLTDLRIKKPPLAKIFEVNIVPMKGREQYGTFSIHRSSKIADLSGSVVPPDIAICDECLQELRNPRDPRYDYFFITCTNCGPRYTTIEKVPYDRDNTTMNDFPMCSFCNAEYLDSLNKRFHAQTVACPKCGPKTYLTTNKGELIDCKDAIRETGRLLTEGFVVAVKGYGGFHIAAATTKDKPLFRLRKVKQRRQKPFAVMARNLEIIKSFAEIGLKEADLLTSYMRPIVLLNKSKDYCLSKLVAPGLHNVGVMLPYTGLHYMLFDRVDEPAFVMTSANPPNQPIVKDDTEALKELDDVVDYFLFHNRQVAHRCDDSVIRVHGEHQAFIRRSRGFAPAPIVLNQKTKRCVLGLGGELNNTACVLLENRAFVSQHIGDVENIETRNFLEEATKHLISLTNSKIEVVACDLHPKFTTTHLANELAKENNWQLIQVQHHYAHVAALMAEQGVDEAVGICCDGYGYGLDGEAWGGEILMVTSEPSSFKRLAHLQRQPLIGGDMATLYPLRVAAGMLHINVDVENWLLQNKECFPYGEREIRILLDHLKKGNVVKTTSCGRVLDAVSAVLGICFERTYEGEPAMKLESSAIKGKDVLRLKPIIEGDILNTTHMLWEIFENKGKYSKPDLAFSAHTYLAEGLSLLAIEKASEYGVKTIGFSGGVACNEILAFKIRKAVGSSGFKFLAHGSLPPGDGCLSLGQAYVASYT